MHALSYLSRLMRLGLGVLLLALFAMWPVLAAAQTSPCADSSTTLVLNPTKVYAQLPDHTAVIMDTTTPLVASYELRTYLAGASSPMHTVGIGKSAWTLVTGTADCYTAALPSVPIAINTRYTSRLVAKGDVSVGDSPESEPSNPFGRPATPQAPVLRVAR